jgi:hypothetical protein
MLCKHAEAEEFRKLPVSAEKVLEGLSDRASAA